MSKWIDGRSYAMACGIRVALLVLLTLCFPFLVGAVIRATGASRVGGASGAVALILGVYLKPLIYLGFTASICRISMRRAASVGMSAIIGVCMTLLVLSDLGFGIAFGANWSVAFSMGILSIRPPASLIAALIAMITLSLLKDSNSQAEESWASAYRLWLWLMVALLVMGTLGMLTYAMLIFGGRGAHGGIIAMMYAQGYLTRFFLYPHVLLLLFAAASAWLVAASRRSTDNQGQSPPSAHGSTPLFGGGKPGDRY